MFFKQMELVMVFNKILVVILLASSGFTVFAFNPPKYNKEGLYEEDGVYYNEYGEPQGEKVQEVEMSAADYYRRAGLPLYNYVETDDVVGVGNLFGDEEEGF